MNNKLIVSAMVVCSMSLGGCVATPGNFSDPQATMQKLQERQFQVIEDNSGQYMSPFTSDGVTAEWVEKSINAQLGASLGSTAGAYAGQKALEQVPFVGGFLGQKVGKEAGRNIALASIGGDAFLRQSSDLSFNNVHEMAGWLLANHGDNPKFQEVLKATTQIYPELQDAYVTVLAGGY